MRLHYYKDTYGNFGDDLNPWLWSRLIPDLLDDDGRTLLVGIGTILNDRIPSEPAKVVFGSGCGYGQLPIVDEKWKFFCVRGPRTAAKLGLDPGLAITDPALLARSIMPPVSELDRDGVVFVPHHISMHRANAQGIDVPAACADTGIEFLDPAGEVDVVLDRLRRAQLVLSEAMHAAILADAFRVPWISVRLYNHILQSKWFDFAESLELTYEPHAFEANDMTVSNLSQFIARTALARPLLSDEKLADARLGQLHEKLGSLRKAHAAGDLPVGDEGERISAHNSELWWLRLRAASEVIEVHLPKGAPFLLMDDMKWSFDRPTLAACARLFPPKADAYQQIMDSDSSVVSSFEARLAETCTNYLVVGWPAFWWLDHYPKFRGYLEKHSKPLAADENIIIYQL